MRQFSKRWNRNGRQFIKYLPCQKRRYLYPPSNKSILHGCVRIRAEKFAGDLGMPFIEKAFTVDDIPDADELFLSSSTSEIMPVIKVDSSQIADGKPGSITRKLQYLYEQDAAITHMNV